MHTLPVMMLAPNNLPHSAQPAKTNTSTLDDAFASAMNTAKNTPATRGKKTGLEAESSPVESEPLQLDEDSDAPVLAAQSSGIWFFGLLMQNNTEPSGEPLNNEDVASILEGDITDINLEPQPQLDVTPEYNSDILNTLNNADNPIKTDTTDNLVKTDFTTNPDAPDKINNPHSEQLRNSDVELIQTSEVEVTARMPQQMTGPITENIETSEELTVDEDTPAVLPEVKNEGELCPLENESDTPDSQTGETTNPETNKVPEKTRKTVSEPPVHKADEPETNHETTSEQSINSVHQMVNIEPEKLASSQKLEAAAEPKPVTPDSLFDEMVERIDVMHNSETNMMEIQLKPEFLGKVSIQLLTAAGGLHVKIQSDDTGVRSMIGSQINQLIESLTTKDIKIAEVEVVYTGVSDQSMNEQNGNTQQYSENRRPVYKWQQNDHTTPPSFWEQAQMAQIDTDLSSIEYRA